MNRGVGWLVAGLVLAASAGPRLLLGSDPDASWAVRLERECRR